MARQSATSARRMKASETRKEVLRYKTLGFTNPEIADLLDISRQHVHTILKETKEEDARETAEYVAGLNVKRMEALDRMMFVARKLLERIAEGEVEIEYDENGKEVSRTVKPAYAAIDKHLKYELGMAEVGGYMAPKGLDMTSSDGSVSAAPAVLLLPMSDDPALWEQQAAKVRLAGESEIAALEQGSDEAAPSQG